MTLWTIQSMDAWKTLQDSGGLRARTDIVDQDNLPAYRWMSDRMEEQIGARPSPDALPVWAWYQWEGAKRRRPDLRAGGHLPRGEKGVRIEFDIDDRLVLLSDFELWHYVLNFWYLPSSEHDGERFEAQLERNGIHLRDLRAFPNSLHANAIRDSWRRIFDIDWACHNISWPLEKKSIQATLWTLETNTISAVTEFTSR